jgi:hypothetical protein
MNMNYSRCVDSGVAAYLVHAVLGLLLLNAPRIYETKKSIKKLEKLFCHFLDQICLCDAVALPTCALVMVNS